MHRVLFVSSIIVISVVAIGCTQPADPQQAKIDALKAEVADLETKRVANLPKDEATQKRLAEAERYYKEPEWVWATCREFAARLKKKGNKASADEILDASVVVMERLGVRREGKQSIRDFCNDYESRRIDPYWGDGRHGPANHEEAVDLLVRDQKFGSVVSPEVEKLRRLQPLTAGETVRLGSLSNSSIRTLDGDNSTSVEIPNGTRAQIERVVEDREGMEHRMVFVRILEGSLAGHRLDVSPAEVVPR